MKEPLRSMTGFAQAEGQMGGIPFRCEIKSLNHRHLDIKCRLPRDLSSAEMPIRELVSSKLGKGARGSIDILIDWRPERAPGGGEFQINLSAAAAYYEALRSAQKILGLGGEVVLADLFRFPDMVTRVDASTPALKWDAIEPSLTQALSLLLEGREREGLLIHKALRSFLETLEQGRVELSNLRLKSLASSKQKASERIRLILDQAQVRDPQIEFRIAQEVALAADRSDIEEELQRLGSHLEHVAKLLDSPGPRGRKLEFALQEVHREFNTLGSKCQDVAMSQIVVELKSVLEQMKEQVLNIE